MNYINKKPIASLGYHFVDGDEYRFRNLQNKNHSPYRNLTPSEIETLVGNRNSSDNWDHVLVSDLFAPELVADCKFFGLVRIGKLEPFYLEFHNLRVPVGLYDSSIISSDFGDNVAISNVNYLSHYIIGSDTIIANVNELATTENAKFGNGSHWIELRNENGGRKILPFVGMLPGDAFLWSSLRGDAPLQEKFASFTEKKSEPASGHYGTIGDRTVIKNCKIIKDVIIGSDAYLKGANKLKNLTISSSPENTTQIGEGCELVNGIIGEGCRIFYGAKAVRFVMASNSQLKYGARLINSYLGNNSTISCCEVLNALIFPAHEQHHNNSFLCAALLMGQSNIAAGATIGSNHNSRSADGEIIAGRGFWPGLCTSLKHSSKFASFTLLAKGDYPHELNIPIPFSLLSNNTSKDELTVMPAYWFMHNMYALARNSWKYIDRDKRTDRPQLIEYDFLAPDSINEMLSTIRLMEKYGADKEEIEIPAGIFENSKRPVKLIKAAQAYRIFKEMIVYHATVQLAAFLEKNTLADLQLKFGRTEWTNVGGQLIQQPALKTLIADIHSGKIKSWDDIHLFYKEQSANYPTDKLHHALAALEEIYSIKLEKSTVKKLLVDSIATREWIVQQIHDSRSKDHENPFRKMTYESTAEMEAVIGKLEDNSFIRQEEQNLAEYRTDIHQLLMKLKL